MSLDLHPCRIMWGLAGSPPVQDVVPVHGRCRICALPMGRGKLFSKWSGSDFTDQNKVKHHESDHVCEACVWVHAWNCPPGYDVGDAKRGPSLRTYSHLWHDGSYVYASKGDKPTMLRFLREPKHGPWFACLTDAGQKHLLPYTPVNLDGRTAWSGSRNVLVTRG